MLSHQDAQEGIVLILLISTEFLLEQTAYVDAKMPKNLKQIETRFPALITTFAKVLFVFVEMVNLWCFGCDKTLGESRAKLVDMVGGWRAPIRYRVQHVAQLCANILVIHRE